jgi:hypothetical protein
VNAAETLQAARAAGLTVGSDGGDLVLAAAAPPTSVLLDALSRHKSAILALLRSAEDWQVLFDERAGIAEHDGCLPRKVAEAQALDYCVAEWMNLNPTSSPPGCCAQCGTGDHPADPLLPIKTTGQVRLHSACRTAWEEGRRRKAIAALARMEIRFPK